MATSNNEWLHIYQNNLAGTPQQHAAVRWQGDVTEVTDATTVTTTTMATTSSVSDKLGRVTRPNNPRRRTRASRKTPTTLLNTDTTNFRAMVQQFTGGNFCSGVSSDNSGIGNNNNNTGFMAAQTAIGPRQPLSSYNTNNYYGMGSTGLPPSVGGYNMEFRQPQHQHYYPIVTDNNGGGDHQQGFVQRIQEGGL
ncbi:uncharacterized protein LOC143586327 [Bidens hawaiensis]|uniref:uncharacterized protein LOC143586327 n=1 Tax=Bidens hawaiensis TaxID=980011 RepID=UPI004048FDAE